VQAEGCAPIVQAFYQGDPESQPWPNASTDAAGLRVPHALGDFLILRAIRDTGGTAVAVSDDEMRSAQQQLATAEGIWVGLEGAATVAALRQLRQTGWLEGDEQVVLFLTSSGLK
jgi:threonine synthase